MTVFLPLAGRAVGPGRPQADAALLADRPVVLTAIPMYLLMRGHRPARSSPSRSSALLYVPQLATISATFPAMFPTHVRYAGIGDRLQRVDVAVRRDGARHQRLADPSDGQQFVPAI